MDETGAKTGRHQVAVILISCDFLSRLCLAYLFKLHCTIRLSFLSVGYLYSGLCNLIIRSILEVIQSISHLKHMRTGIKDQDARLLSSHQSMSSSHQSAEFFSHFFSSGLINLEFFYTQQLDQAPI